MSDVQKRLDEIAKVAIAKETALVWREKAERFEEMAVLLNDQCRFWSESHSRDMAYIAQLKAAIMVINRGHTICAKDSAERTALYEILEEEGIEAWPRVCEARAKVDEDLEKAGCQKVTCEWQPTETGQWHTSCGEMFEFTTDGPEDNGAKYCMYCGGVLVEVGCE